ncbi:GCN5-related N-acetyl-transferase-domain-containing protein [Hyaloraphidium curvatum]|nr:GCN5-related N-acetyl-transferase-domain-containing protein [Hyaloraphidium curvatum]
MSTLPSLARHTDALRRPFETFLRAMASSASYAAKTPDDVEWDAPNSRFVLRLGPGGQKDEAVLEYEDLGGTWDMQHTFTPTAHRGNGYAEIVTTKAIETARKEGKKVVPSCWYVRGYLDKRPDIAKELLDR